MAWINFILTFDDFSSRVQKLKCEHTPKCQAKSQAGPPKAENLQINVSPITNVTTRSVNEPRKVHKIPVEITIAIRNLNSIINHLMTSAATWQQVQTVV